MQAVVQTCDRAATPCAEALQRFERLERGAVFCADWMQALLLHYAIPADVLQPYVPFELDLRDGCAWVSLVAFEQQGLRPARPAKPAWLARGLAVLSTPLATHGFLNVRTYVREQGEPGIYFLSECIPNLLAVAIGPRLYGLPYRIGRLDYRLDAARGTYACEIGLGLRRNGPRCRLEARWDARGTFEAAPPGTRTEFLLERYTAYTARKGVKRRFRIWHEPWPQTPCEISLSGRELPRITGPWWPHARFVGANFSTGARSVQIGRPWVFEGA